MRWLLLTAVFYRVVSPVLVESYLGRACMGEALWGGEYKHRTGCVDVHKYEAAYSILVAGLHDKFGVELFKGGNCDAKKSLGIVTTKECFISAHHVGSYKVLALHPQSRNRRYIEDNHPIGPTTLSKELVEYGDKNKTPSTDVLPPGLDFLPFSVTTIAVTAITAGGALSIANNIKGCVNAARNQQPEDIYDCVSAFVSLILTYAGGYYYRREIANSGVARHLRGAVGRIQNGHHDELRKRQLIDAYNWKFMSSLCNSTEWPARHVGFMKRNDISSMGEQKSPLFEFAFDEDRKFHLTAFTDRFGNPVFHMAPLTEQDLGRRAQPGYNDTRTASGGWDFTMCGDSANANPYDFGEPNRELYESYYKDFKCLVSRHELVHKNAIIVDAYDKHQKRAFTVGIAPYADARVSSAIYAAHSCKQGRAHYDANCVF